MIEKIINRIVDFLEIENLIKQEQEEFYRYGSELLVMSLINGFSVLLVGIVTKHFILAVVYILIFAFVRTEIGGFHASTYFRCFSYYMCIFFFIICGEQICLQIQVKRVWMILISVCVLILEFAFAPVTMKRKLKEEERRQAKRNGIIKTLLCMVIMYVSFDFYLALSYDIFLILCVITGLMVIGKYSSKKEITGCQ